jgi:hypothetical protein
MGAGGAARVVDTPRRPGRTAPMTGIVKGWEAVTIGETRIL